MMEEVESLRAYFFVSGFKRILMKNEFAKDKI